MGQGQGKEASFSDDVNLNHFKLLRVVGKGAFGKVRIVERKDTGLTFALKYIRKDEVVRSESVRNILRERRMLEHLNHPFICNLRYSFQDIEYMYIVVDLMTGGDLRFHISRKTFTEEAVQFWIAELGCALRYIHNKGIIHRDVKPDNVLLDSEGHVHLADFNVASDFVPGKKLTSKSGTLAYLAPEVYLGQGYSSGADWWSLGVLFYECIYNKRPFEGGNSASLGAAIMAAQPKFPVTSPPVPIPCLHAISSALEPDPSKRMGAAGFETFMDNPFFQSIDFEALERKEIEPVFVPSSEKTNFDATYDLEELLLEEAPLEARARRQKPREALKEDASGKEIREHELYQMIESHFDVFDYTTAAFDRFGGDVDESQKTLKPLPEAVSPASSKSSSSEKGNSGTEPVSVRKSASPRHTNVSNISSISMPSSHDGSPPAVPPPLAKRLTNGRTAPNFSTPQLQSGGRHPRSTRTASAGGGMHVVLDGTGSWSDLAKHDTTLPADAKDIAAKPTGMLGFLNRKKGRGHSPKPQERGILGKEGARVVISG